jgi:hypothetical protein
MAGFDEGPIITVDPVRELFEAMDADADGVLTKYEFLEYICKHKPKFGIFSTTAKLMSGECVVVVVCVQPRS